MTDQTQTKKMAGGTLPAPEAVDRPGSVDNALERLWHFLISMKLALILMLAFAALTIIGALIIQAPAGVMDDPQAKAQWLAGVRPRFSAVGLPFGWFGISIPTPWLPEAMDRLQVFTIFTSVWLRVIGALLAASLIACTVHRIPGVWQTVRKPHVDVGPSFFEHAPQHEAMTFHRSSAQVLETTSAVFKRRHYRVLSQEDGTVHLYFDRNRWAPWGGLIAHAAIVVILAGAMIGSMFGFRDGQFMLSEGATSAIPKVAGATITLNSFKDTYNTSTGAPLDFVSNVTVTKDGQQVLTQDVRVNEPLRYGGVSFYQSFFGPAAVLTVKDKAGTVLYAGGVPLAFDSKNGGNRIGTFTLPDQNMAVWVVATSGPNDTSIKPGQVGVELYKADSGDPIVQKSIDQGAATTVQDLSFTFEREAKYTGLSVASDPGTPIVWLGCILLVLGFAVRLYVPFRRVWGRLEARPDGGSSLSIAAVGRRDSGFDAEFTAIVTDIRQAVTAQARS